MRGVTVGGGGGGGQDLVGCASQRPWGFRSNRALRCFLVTQEINILASL